MKKEKKKGKKEEKKKERKEKKKRRKNEKERKKKADKNQKKIAWSTFLTSPVWGVASQKRLLLCILQARH